MYFDTRSLVLFVYWVAGLFLLAVAIKLAKTWLSRAVAVAAVVLIFSYYPVKRELQEREDRRFRDAAGAHFKKQCEEKAGERISRVVDNVDGIFLVKPRVKASEESLRDQFWMGDPYGYSDYEAANPADTYLYGRSGETISERRITPIKGFKFVEMPNPEYTSNGQQRKYLRYTLKNIPVREGDRVVVKPRPVPQAVNSLKSRFAITWEDISTRDDREFWVAGGSLRIIDLQTNETIAERIGYVIDPQLGFGRQRRLVWIHVNFRRGAFCPTFETDFHKNKEFVGKVLRGSREGNDAN
jgi:hypothetical protein